MPSTRDLLQRFRPAGAPGAATATGVPADRIEEREAELAPVFHLLEDAVAEAARIRQEAAAEAQRRPQQARAAASASVAAARLEVSSIRAHALAEAQQEATDLARASAAVAEDRAHSIGDRSRRTLAADVTAVVARVRAALAAAPDRPPP